MEVQGSKFGSLGDLKSIKKVIGIRMKFRDRNLEDILVPKWSMFDRGAPGSRPAGPGSRRERPGGRGRRPRRRPWNQKQPGESDNGFRHAAPRTGAADLKASPLPPAPSAVTGLVWVLFRRSWELFVGSRVVFAVDFGRPWEPSSTKR